LLSHRHRSVLVVISSPITFFFSKKRQYYLFHITETLTLQPELETG
jgi:hypothetical protein